MGRSHRAAAPPDRPPGRLAPGLHPSYVRPRPHHAGMASLDDRRAHAPTSLLDTPVQTTLDQSIPLHAVTFCVVDLETTGGSPTDSRITEIGAVTCRGGERLGAFQSLVDPGVGISPFITQLTGI